MTTNQTFSEQYDALQHKWRQRAQDHGHQYLQYLAPRISVDYVLAGKMTSIGEKDAAMVDTVKGILRLNSMKGIL